MKQTLIPALETICPNNVYLQGTLAADAAYPDSFITFWTNSTDNDGFYDNSEYAFDWNFSVFFYSNNPALVGTKPAEIITALKAVGFIPQGKGHDFPSDLDSHTGWAMEFVYKQIITNSN